MSRYRQTSGSLADDLGSIFRALPWWVGLVSVPVAWAVFRFALPVLLNSFAPGPGGGATVFPYQVLATGSAVLSLPIAFCVALIWAGSRLGRWGDARRLESVAGIESIRALGWREFEQLLAEAFRRQGFAVRETPDGADGGVDLVLSRGGRETLVQAKQWKTWRVGVKVVRELNGVRTSDPPQDAIVVTSGSFTTDARAFADERGIQLIDGQALVPMIGRVQRSGRVVETRAPEPSQSRPACPACGVAMVQRTAKRGPTPGQMFWGCPSYPVCRGTRGMGEEVG